MNHLAVIDGLIKDHHRIGKINSTKNANSQTVNKLSTNRKVILTLHNDWNPRILLQKAVEMDLYKEKGIIITRDLNATDLTKEKLILKKRWELINSGVPKHQLKIRNLKLYNNSNEVPIGNL